MLYSSPYKNYYIFLRHSFSCASFPAGMNTLKIRFFVSARNYLCSWLLFFVPFFIHFISSHYSFMFMLSFIFYLFEVNLPGYLESKRFLENINLGGIRIFKLFHFSIRIVNFPLIILTYRFGRLEHFLKAAI